MGTQEPGGLGGIRRILIVQTAYLGDLVLTLPLIDAVRQRFPPAHIAVLTVPVNAALLYGQPGVDAVIPFDKRGMHKGLRGMRPWVNSLPASSALLSGLSGTPMIQRATPAVPRPARVLELRQTLRQSVSARIRAGRSGGLQPSPAWLVCGRRSPW